MEDLMGKSAKYSKDRILNAAVRVIRRKGVANTSLADIAKELGMSKGTLYYYYASKSDLIFDLTERHIRYITEEILDWVAKAKDEASPQEILHVVLNLLLRGNTRGPVHLYLLQDAIGGNEILRRRFLQEYGRWRQILREGLEQLLGERGDVEVRAAVLMAVIDGLLLEKLVGVRPLFLREISEFLTR